ncbi:MAG: hypothetical protein H6734_18640 [Alphaproteobacteria bacterium]|nr:hypothetical protein [Alphaproteobacteria bacterium]
MTDLDDWLADGDPGDADWMPHLLGLATRGQLGHTGRLLLDLPALSQRWSCVPGMCSPGMRTKRARSCCADLEVGVSPTEEERIREAWTEVEAHMADDPRWSRGAPEAFDDGTLTRPGRRCVFAKATPDGLQCGLHQLEDATGRARGALKPMPCRLFPLVIVEMDDGRFFITAIHRRTARLAGSRPAAAFPCLGATSQTLAAGCEDILTGLWGKRTARRIVKLAEEAAS